jgi:hypothetical protein
MPQSASLHGIRQKLSCDEMFIVFPTDNGHALLIMRNEFIGDLEHLVKIPICTK